LIWLASSTGLPNTISVAIDEQAIATAHPMHLNFAFRIKPFSMRKVIKTVSPSIGLRTIALPEGLSIAPVLRGFA
jgi:hypothetical protein